MPHTQITSKLLAWYDGNAREMPWRVGPAARKAGILPNPYSVWLSEVMLQQTTVAAVSRYHQDFIVRWPSVQDLARARDADVMAAWAGLGYYARARNLLKCARALVNDYDGVFPDTYDGLINLPGIGPYTAAAIAAIAFDQPETVLDGNVERVMARLNNDHTPLPGAKPIFKTYAQAHTPMDRPGDYAQAIMDLGAMICVPTTPKCSLCPIQGECAAFALGEQKNLPKKTPKKPKPTRYGIAYVARRADGAWLLETRAPKGLLGGMLGWPTTDWGDALTPAPPCPGDWKALPHPARHTFTHFHLILRVQTALLPIDCRPDRGAFFEKAKFSPAALPTIMRKAYDLATATLGDI